MKETKKGDRKERQDRRKEKTDGTSDNGKQRAGIPTENCVCTAGGLV
jgi:hypothetical protein